MPAEVQEAAAALHDLAFRTAPPDGPDRAAERLARLRELQHSLPPAIVALPSGPLLVTNLQALTDWLGRPLPAYPQLALCRCGGSAIKPLCDGTHVDIRFSDARDPRRVPDRLDTYAGARITVTGNRGTCAHSGFCTDRLSQVFRMGREPFVALDGGDEADITHAVRACPSGALGLVSASAGADAARAPVRDPTSRCRRTASRGESR